MKEMREEKFLPRRHSFAEIACHLQMLFDHRHSLGSPGFHFWIFPVLKFLLVRRKILGMNLDLHFKIGLVEIRSRKFCDRIHYEFPVRYIFLLRLLRLRPLLCYVSSASRDGCSTDQ